MAKPVLLTVDDDSDVLRVIERDLRKQYGDRYRVLGADAPQAALEVLRQLKTRNDSVALLLADQRMPNLDGVGFLKEAMQIFPEAKRALLTAYADTNAAVSAINEANIHYFFTKPWDPPAEHLYPVLDDLLDDWLANFRAPYEGLRVLGTRWSPKCYEMRDFLARNHVPYQWIDVEASAADPETQRLVVALGADSASLPVALFPDGTRMLQCPPSEVAKKIGLRTQAQTTFYELAIVGELRVEGPSRIRKRAEGSEISCHALMGATGVQWRRLEVPGMDRLQGAGVYYGGGATEALSCKDEDVYVIGGANSAGQAAINFAKYARKVVMLIRGASLSTTMSQYLIDQIQQTPNIELWAHAAVVEVHGGTHLEEISVQCADTNTIERVPASSLFIFIGALPRTDWLAGTVERDDRGFLLTGPDLVRQGKYPAGWTLERDPFLLETNIPGIFAVGDVRHGSVKRVASGVGEGSVAVQFIHQYLSKVA